MASKVGGLSRRWVMGQSQRSRSKSLRSAFGLCSQRRIIQCLVCIALFPPIFFHFRLRRFNQIQERKCGWVNNPPLVCAHGGDSSKAFPNTISAYELALHSKVDCIEIDVSRSSDGVLFALHDRDLHWISGDNTSRVGHLSANEIKELGTDGTKITTIEDALKLVSSSVRQVILDAKVGPPSYEKGLAEDILSVNFVLTCVIDRYTARHEVNIVKRYLPLPKNFKHTDHFGIERTKCRNCLVWAKSDSLARDVIRQSPDTMVGYIVMVDPSNGVRSNLLRMRGAAVVGVYHRLIDQNLVRVLHRRNKKVYAWTVDDAESMKNMLFEGVDAVVTSDPGLLRREMQDIRTQCLEEGFTFRR